MPLNKTQNVSSFSTQEKKILAVLFDNKGISLSYKDIGKLLNKSENTVKVQINQLKNKTNLLNEMIDQEGKKRYALKEKVKLEKFIVTD
ncbi:MAG: hypothetical protein AB1633_03610 [Elusimicrobiota bacterium]